MQSISVAIICFLSIAQVVFSMVATINSRAEISNLSPPSFVNKEAATIRTTRDARLRIRKLREGDLPTVSSLLAHGVVVDSKLTTASEITNPYQALKNWKANTERLRVKADIQRQIQQRLDVIEVGKSHMRSPSLTSSVEFMEEMWSLDTFRNKMERAVKLSSEPSAWHEHNFYCAPSDPRLFQHIMLTVECKDTSAVVGFCEVAMLRTPESLHTYHDDMSRFRPVITNVVVCPLHRRKGIGSRLVKMASRYVSTNWVSSSTLGLYVQNSNEKAMSLYTKEGFDVVGPSDDNPDLLYMECNLHQASFQ